MIIIVILRDSLCEMRLNSAWQKAY